MYVAMSILLMWVRPRAAPTLDRFNLLNGLAH